MIHQIFDFFFPVECIKCHQLGVYLCQTCKKDLYTHPFVCPVCHRNTDYGQLCVDCHASHTSSLDGMIVGFRYEELIKQAILQLKYHHRHGIATMLAEQLAWHIQTHDVLKSCTRENTLLSYIPSHFRRRVWVKAYNQSQLLAAHLGKILDIDVQQLTEKNRHTKRQAKLSREKRMTNLYGSFCWHKVAKIKEGIKTIILVDDVTTTGSTLQEVGKTIKKDYPQVYIWGAVVARHG